MYQLYPYLVIESKEFYDSRKDKVECENEYGVLKYKDSDITILNNGDETNFPQFYKYIPLLERYVPIDKEELLEYLQQHLKNFKEEVERTEQKIKQYS